MPPYQAFTQFTSQRHPGNRPWAGVFSETLIPPLAICMLPVMTGALITVLQGYDAILFLLIGFPLAVLAAFGWTYYDLQRTVASISVRPHEVAMKTVWECLRSSRGTSKSHGRKSKIHGSSWTWLPLYEVRIAPKSIVIAIGDASLELDTSEWPEADLLQKTLTEALYAERPDQPS